MAALEAFAELGYHGTTTRDIAKRAHMSAAAIYSHYSSKGELLFEIILAGHQLMRDRMLTAFAQPGTPAERLARLVATHVDVHARMKTSARIANYELRALSPDGMRHVTALRREMHGIMREAIRLGVESGDFFVDDVEASTVAVLSLGVDVSRWFVMSHRLSSTELAALYSKLVLRMLSATAPKFDEDPQMSQP